MRREDAYRTVSTKNVLNAKVGDKVKFILPDMVDIMASMKQNVVPLIIALVIGVFVSNVLREQDSTLRITLSLAAFFFSNFGLKIVFEKFFRDEKPKKKYDIKMLEIMENNNPFEQ